MIITFLGAAHEVTGSCTLVESGGLNLLIDCGMEQGRDTFVNEELSIAPGELDAVLLTHSHIDHSGKLPLLYKNGFRGSIYATQASTDLCRIMLLDSAHIQEQDAIWKNRKAKRSGDDEYEPLYDTEDVYGTLKLFVPCEYNKVRPIAEGAQIRFNDAGHLLGSSSIELWLTENGETKKIVFSGDVGNINQPLINDPSPVEEADYVMVESTYGDRYHEEKPDHVKILAEHLQRTFDRGGNVIIPSFAIGRTQEILYFIREIKNKKLVKGHDGFPVYVDSPLANEATGIFLQCEGGFFDEETQGLINSGINPIWFDGIKISETADDSKAINFDQEPKVVISASGMCEAGRIRHHLKHNLWKKEALILFVGYQSVGTLGRIIYDGAESVRLFGEEIAVRAEIAYLPGISGHADKKGLINWLTAFKKKPETVFVNHGEDEVCEDFAAVLTNEYGLKAEAPFSGSCYDLLEGRFVERTEGIPIKKKQPQNKASRNKELHNKLVSKVEQLLQRAKKSEGLSNKELAKMSSQIDNLLGKW